MRPFSGRSLDERVINPFLRDKRIPSSRGPYLSVFRRSVAFDVSTRKGLRDKAAYDALLPVLAHLNGTSDDTELLNFLRYLLYKFAELREASLVPLSRLQRISLEQYEVLISGLLATPSGGRFPLWLIVATFGALRDFFGLNWEIRAQDINVSDAASGAGGDVTIAAEGQTLLAAEITERSVDRIRVVATFNTKIVPAAIQDYLFFTTSPPTDEAREQARRYFAQGHEVNFLEIKNWILMVLATIGSRGRSVFNRELIKLLDSADVPKSLKVAWNEQIDRITGSSAAS